MGKTLCCCTPPSHALVLMFLFSLSPLSFLFVSFSVVSLLLLLIMSTILLPLNHILYFVYLIINFLTKRTSARLQNRFEFLVLIGKLVHFFSPFFILFLYSHSLLPNLFYLLKFHVGHYHCGSYCSTYTTNLFGSVPQY